MKKILFFASALAGLLLAGSCQREEFAPAAEGNVVTFEVSIPEVVATKAGEGYQADGSNVNDLVYAVYSTTAETLEDALKGQLKFFYAVNETSGQSFNEEGKSVVSLELLNDQNYLILFWAQSNDAWVKATGSNINLLNVTYPTSMSANNEHLEAFSGVSFIKNVKGARKETVTLTRPFAQINLATTMPKAFTATLSQSEMTIVGAPLSFNVATNTPGTTYSTVDQPLTFAPADVPVADFKADYTYAGANYIFAGKDNANIATVDVSYKIYTSHGTVNNTIPYVPVQQNYRTNILGNLLTSQAEYTVELEKKWADVELAPDPIYLAAAIGGEVTLDEDIVLTKPLEVVASMTINLNKHTISGEIEKGNGAIVNIADGASVILNGGTIKNTAVNGDAAINNEGTLVLNGVTIEGAPLADGGYSAYAVISSGYMVIEEGTAISADRGSIKVTGSGETIINGGTFTNNNIGSRALTSHVVDVEDGSTHKLTINGGTFKHLHTTTSGGVVICNRTKGTVYVNGGNFSGGNYYGNNNLSDYGYGGTFSVKGGVFSANPAAKYIAAGYKSFEKDGKYHVVAEGTDAIVSSNEDFKNALDNGDKDINLLAGEYTFPGNVAEGVTINCAPGTVFKGTSGLNINGSTVIGATFENEGGVAVSGTIYGTFKNCTFEGEEALRWCYSTAGKEVVFEDCEIKTDFRGFHFDGMDGNVIFRRCKINGFNAYGGEGTATFENCVFGNDDSRYNGLNTYSNTVLTDCQFKFISGKTNFIDMEGTGKTLTITNCTATLDGVAKPVTDFVGGSKISQNTVILEGKTYVSSNISDPAGVTYEGDVFENPINDALYFNNYIFEGDASINVTRTYGAIVLENCKADINGDLITIDNDNNSVMALQNLDLTLAEGKKLIKSTNTIYQVFMANITINGVKMTNENIGQYLENVGWFQVVEEI